ncbi:MAG: hypothetical protein K2O66_03725 [Bacteroidales bacterium]|nr:hypothetical protein [Bacteroidales bacterium]MDE7072460.1 hypothetical protein [Bacteroidales bacterium]
MFEQPYFWYYIGACFFTFMLQRNYIRNNEKPSFVINLIAFACYIAILAFLINGFWHMNYWYQPLYMIGLSLLVALIPIPDNIGAITGLVAAPIFCILMFLDFSFYINNTLAISISSAIIVIWTLLVYLIPFYAPFGYIKWHENNTINNIPIDPDLKLRYLFRQSFNQAAQNQNSLGDDFLDGMLIEPNLQIALSSIREEKTWNKIKKFAEENNLDAEKILKEEYRAAIDKYCNGGILRDIEKY